MRGRVIVWGALGLLIACSGETRDVPPLDCAGPPQYEIATPFRSFDDGSLPWFADGDATGSRTPPPPAECQGAGGSGSGGSAGTGGTQDPRPPTVVLEENPDLCGSQLAAVLRSKGNNDWGAVFGDYNLFVSAADGSSWDGITLWARTARVSDRAVTIILDTKQTREFGVTNDGTLTEAELDAARKAAGTCKTYCNDLMEQTFTDPNGMIVTESDVPPEDACGNGFSRRLHTTDRWQRYFLPFESFLQERLPNAVPAMDRVLLGLTIRADKGAELELWLDEIGFYRER